MTGPAQLTLDNCHLAFAAVRSQALASKLRHSMTKYVFELQAKILGSSLPQWLEDSEPPSPHLHRVHSGNMVHHEVVPLLLLVLPQNDAFFIKPLSWSTSTMCARRPA